MSDRDYRLYLHDILDSGQAIQDFVKGQENIFSGNQGI